MKKVENKKSVFDSIMNAAEEVAKGNYTKADPSTLTEEQKQKIAWRKKIAAIDATSPLVIETMPLRQQAKVIKGILADGGIITCSRKDIGFYKITSAKVVGRDLMFFCKTLYKNEPVVTTLADVIHDVRTYNGSFESAYKAVPAAQEGCCKITDYMNEYFIPVTMKQRKDRVKAAREAKAKKIK